LWKLIAFLFSVGTIASLVLCGYHCIFFSVGNTQREINAIVPTGKKNAILPTEDNVNGCNNPHRKKKAIISTEDNGCNITHREHFFFFGYYCINSPL
jgi:hypothetical protein